MKETGMVFTSPMVRAILEGRKTQTRRVAKEFVGRKDLDNILRRFPKQRGGQYGEPGDRIYVRETFSQHPEWGQLAFRADGEEFEDADGWLWEPKWMPSIHMPKDLARIWLEVTSVRVETLGIISHEDALAEGVSSIEEYKALWININGAWLPETWVWVLDFKGMP